MVNASNMEPPESVHQDSGSKGTKRICYHNRWITFFSILFSSLATAAIWLLILYIILTPSFYSYIGFANNYVLKKPDAITNPDLLQMIGTLAKNGTLLSLDDFWSFQSTLYQTIITVLIALNGIIAAFSFFIIRNSSTARAREEAKNEAVIEVNKYINSTIFEKDINIKLDERIKTLQFDLKTSIEFIEQFEEKNIEGSIQNLESEYNELKRHIRIISKKISLMDNEECNGNSLLIRGKE